MKLMGKWVERKYLKMIEVTQSQKDKCLLFSFPYGS